MCLLLVSLWYIGVLLFPIAVDDFLGDCPCYPSDLPVLLSELEDTDPLLEFCDQCRDFFREAERILPIGEPSVFVHGCQNKLLEAFDFCCHDSFRLCVT